MNNISFLNPGELNDNQVQSQQSSEIVAIKSPNEEVSIQTQTSPVDTEVQSVDDKSTVDIGKSTIDTIVAKCKDGLEKKYIIKYSEAKKAGYKLVVLKGNRKINNNQLNNLYKSAKDKKMFTEGVHVVPLREIFQKFPETKVTDLYGTQIDIKSEDVDKCLVIYDGQHRTAVCELHPDEIDVKLEINKFDGTHPLETIKLMNSYSRNWSCIDLRESNVAISDHINQLYIEAEKLMNLYGVTSKLAEYNLTFKREATKKKDLVNGKDTTLYNEDNANRGRGIMKAFMTNFEGAKEVKKMEFMDSIVHTYDNTEDSKKGVFARMMKLYLGTIDKEIRTEFTNYISNKDYGTLNKKILDGYKAFCEEHTEEELSKMENELSKRIDSFEKRLEESNKDDKKPMKSGYIYEVIKQNKEMSKEK